MSSYDTSNPGPPVGCPQHPDVAAQYVCARCQTAVCINCCYSMPDGTVCCTNCYQQPVARPIRVTAAMPPPMTMPIPPGAGCVQHPDVAPVVFCKLCGTGSCTTCDFVFPGNVHLCPVCAGSAGTKLSPRRKKYLTVSFIMAVWVTLCCVVLLSGALADAAEEDLVAMLILSFVVIGLMLVPAAIGTAFGMSALRKGVSNPISVWLATIWNALVLAALMLLMIVGRFSE